MKCDVLTLFPDIINTYLRESILKRAQEKMLIEVTPYNIRNFTTDKHHTVDDYSFGGGPGMVLKPEPIFRAIDFLKKDNVPRRVVLLSPQGKPFNQLIAKEYSREKRRLVFICGRYEGIDERVRLALIDEEISIGDYIMTGGELAALVIIDVSTRLIPGALGDEKSVEEESFSWGLLDYPHFTRPREFQGLSVPDVLISGNHKEILRWRRKEALKKTIKQRPDLIKKIKLSDEDKKIISELEISCEDEND
ncbi:MAG: tRNA (guanosine(37)-N1)-methyltransferase TrmD [Thermodesulfovibrionia bacterium]|nr:tRNA (guanosine(37)-N1)-methyltransferase TrmD [Thermodesulfovibrionia bacterium]MCK5426133.1 tRNA (guanosine(37)-N1)-methyltransferase TrmD [Thermodesulfovibrionia bacterium]MCK5511538.1 tRNA (guanosine(37)-N1)-methyltransferase TrmD [Thermodesulfovibrionia bacterium]